MAEVLHHLSHILVTERTATEEFQRPGGGDRHIRPVENRVSHGRNRLAELHSSLEVTDENRENFTEAELRALGTIITLEGDDPSYPLRLDSLQRNSTHRAADRRQPKWLLLTVLPADPQSGRPERATVWVSDQYRDAFIKLFEDYVSKESANGNPKNNELVANISRIHATILRDLWQSSGEPPAQDHTWWEIWLRPSAEGAELLRRFGTTFAIIISPRHLHLVDREVMWIKATWDQLQPLPFSSVPIAEIRRPEFIDTIEDLSADEQAEYVDDLAERIHPAGVHSPAVCHLDTGVARNHVLLDGSLAAADLQTVVGTSGADTSGHGTRMAGLALLGPDIDELLVSRQPIALRHRLESVRILPNTREQRHDPLTYGDVTAQAVSLPELTANRKRVFCMPVSTDSDSHDNPGQPTLWSATVDALAAGAHVVRNGDELQLLASPDSNAARLFVLSAANVETFGASHLDTSDAAPVRDPGQAWNALTVGAYTELTSTPSDPTYNGWEALAPSGELSPHSRTSREFGARPWPIKPDILMEGGNVLYNGADDFNENHPLLTLRTTGHSNDQALASANATSAATAQAARLAALTMERYPEFWPETVRALLTHHAEWTPEMRASLDTARRGGLRAQHMLLRRYGWGVPTEERVLYSSEQAVTLVVQDEFTPFVGDKFKIPAFRLHDLPWPASVLQELGPADVKLRVTLSYFIEPTASRRGWRQRYSYASHALRFELQDPLETERQFTQRINKQGRAEEGGERPGSGRISWLIGPNQRNLGSLHQDIWETSGIELSQTGKLAIYPVGGWWKNNRNRERAGRPVRYALIVSLSTESSDVDLYTPIANLLQVPTAVPINGS